VIKLKKGVIFDFDGVIINSSEIQRQALLGSYKLIVGEGIPSFEEFFSHSGDSLENIFLKMNLPLEMVEPYRKISREKIDLIKTYPGIKDLLEKLTTAGYKCALCTGKDRIRTLEMLAKLKFDKYFETVACSDDVENPKPHKDSLILAINNLGISLDNAVMIGDARNDIICAKNAGVKSIAVTWGDVSRGILEREKPSYIADTVDELFDAIICLIGYNGVSNVKRELVLIQPG
jgi:pyrophosphatase PpaX